MKRTVKWLGVAVTALAAFAAVAAVEGGGGAKTEDPGPWKAVARPMGDWRVGHKGWVAVELINLSDVPRYVGGTISQSIEYATPDGGRAGMVSGSSHINCSSPDLPLVAPGQSFFTVVQFVDEKVPAIAAGTIDVGVTLCDRAGKDPGTSLTVKTTFRGSNRRQNK